MFEALLARIAEALTAASIPYLVIGGQALMRHAEPRFTEDVDITLGLGTERLDEVLAVAKAIGLDVRVLDPTRFVSETMVLPCRDSMTGIPVDLVLSTSEFERSAIARADHFKERGVDVAYAAFEDLLVMKLVAGRPRDLEDARAMLLKRERYDEAHVMSALAWFEKVLERALLDDYRRLRSAR